MNKSIRVLFIIAMLILLMSFGKFPFSTKSVEVPSFLKQGISNSEFLIPSQPNRGENQNYIELRSDFIGFKEALGFKESQGRYDAINELGYLGKYQFGASTLALLGIYDTEAFLHDAALQEKAIKAYSSRNKWILRKYIKRFVDKRINGTMITESGLLAAAHLAGAGNVKKYLYSGGENNISDSFGSTVAHYIKTFANFDLSSIKMEKNAKVR